MKKKGLVIGMVLSLVVCLCLALFCACGETNTNTGDTGNGEPSAQYEIYEKYVAYASAAGDDVLSYEEWLDSIRGKDGVDGKDGSDGQDGADGKSAYDIWLENGHSGTESDFLDWLKGEKGDTGAAGAQGEKGEDGQDGADGQDGKDGQNGTNGQDGKSAYDIWKENGHSGTEIEFLEWLKGEKGENGQNGADGKDGKDGLSAFDIFKKYYPFYDGSEEEWLADLVNGNLTVYKVIFKSEVAEDIVRRVFKGHDLTDIPEVPEKEGQASAKWDREDFTNITEDIEVHAVYTMKKLTVTFHNEYTEEEDETRTVEYGQAVEDVPTVMPKADQLAYWDISDFSRITADMTVNAVYETEGLAFTLINDQKEYKVFRGTMSAEAKELYIPKMHDGKPVTVIAENAFGEGDRYVLNFESAFLPNTILEIRRQSFANNINLQKISIPESATTLGEMAFCNCHSLTEIHLPSITNIPFSAFSACYALENIQMPKVTSVGTYAFEQCTSLSSISLPSISVISDGLFKNCYELKSVDMKQAIKIGREAFYGCKLLTNIEMPNVTSIGDYAFSGSALEHLEIPSGVTSIGSYLFENCTSLKYVILPSGITFIGYDVFKGCSIFETIYFKGNAKEWAALDKSEAGEVFNDAKVYYYAGPMPEENVGDYWHYDVDDKTPVVWKKED